MLTGERRSPAAGQDQAPRPFRLPTAARSPTTEHEELASTAAFEKMPGFFRQRRQFAGESSQRRAVGGRDGADASHAQPAFPADGERRQSPTSSPVALRAKDCLLRSLPTSSHRLFVSATGSYSALRRKSRSFDRPNTLSYSPPSAGALQPAEFAGPPHVVPLDGDTEREAAYRKCDGIRK